MLLWSSPCVSSLLSQEHVLRGGWGLRSKVRCAFKTFDMDGQTALWKEQANHGPPSSMVLFLWVKMLLSS